MRKLKTIYIDALTGEQYPEGTQLEVKPPRRTAKYKFGKEGFAMTGRKGAGLIARLRLATIPGSLLWYLIENCEFGNELHISQKTMADELGTSTPKISQALAVLLSHNIIEYTGTYCRVKKYRLSPAHFWRGSPESHQAETAIKRALPKPRLKVVADNTTSA